MTAIIIEGPDRVGKSTQIKRLMKFFAGSSPMQWLHYTSIRGLDENWQTELFKTTFNHMFKLITREPNVIWFLDRSHLGEKVYGPVYRPNSNTDYVWDLEKKYKIGEREDVFLLLFYDSSFENLKRDDGDSYTVELDACRKEVERFKAAYYSTSIRKKIMIDIANKDTDQVTKELYAFFKDTYSALEPNEVCV